jgi:ribosomal protein L40E
MCKQVREKHITNQEGDCVSWCPLCKEINQDMEKGILPKICMECGANFPVRLTKCPECSTKGD